MENNSLLAATCFAVGVGALLWVFRRTIMRARRLGASHDIRSMHTRHLSAEAQIDEISAREWLATWRGALKFQRGATALTPPQLAQLVALTGWQSSHRRSNNV